MTCDECLTHEWTTDQLIVLKKQEALNMSPSTTPLPNCENGNTIVTVGELLDQMVMDKIINSDSKASADMKQQQSNGDCPSSDNNNGVVIDSNNQINLSK